MVGNASFPTCVISAVGTSVFVNASADIKAKALDFSRTQADPASICTRSQFEGQDIYSQVLNYLRSQQGSLDAVRSASAELNSLSRILDNSAHRSNQLWFLATDTPDGALAARIISDFAIEHFGIDPSNVHVRHIEGLRIDSDKAFLRDGVRNLIAEIYNALSDADESTYRRVINPTGGFKGVVPYLTIIGMIEPNVEVSYIFERSEALITLQRIPFSLDFESFHDKTLALEALTQVIYEDELRDILKLDKNEALESSSIWPLVSIEVDGNTRLFQLNPLGNIVLEHLRSRARSVNQIYLSEKARKKLTRLDNNIRMEIENTFEHMRNLEWLKANWHASGKNGMKILKASDAERILYYSTDDGVLVIAEIGLKNDGSYDQMSDDLEKLRPEDYPRFELWEKMRP